MSRTENTGIRGIDKARIARGKESTVSDDKKSSGLFITINVPLEKETNEKTFENRPI